MKKNSTVAPKRKQMFREQKLTIGIDLGDRFTYYCVLDEAGEVMVEQKLATTKQAPYSLSTWPRGGRWDRTRAQLKL